MGEKIEKVSGSFGKLQATSYKLPASSGFTLVEMLIAFAIFAIIMVIATGSLISLIGANHKAQALKTVVNNLHFALENMSRNIRTGTNYHCGAGTVTLTQDCATTPETQLVFKTRDGAYMLYVLHEGAIKRAKDTDSGALLNQANWIPITAPEITLDKLNFYVDGAAQVGGRQPRVLIITRGSMQGKNKVTTRFDIETLVSQRLLDL